MARQRRLEFQQRLQNHLQERLPEKGITMPSDQLARQIDVGVSRAKGYQLRRECDVARYVEIVCSFLGGFQDRCDPLPVRNFLHDRRVGPPQRLDQLEKWAREIEEKP